MSDVSHAIAALREQWWGAGTLSDLPGCNRASGNGLVRDCRDTVGRWWEQDGEPHLYWHEVWVTEDDRAPGQGRPRHHKLFCITDQPLPRSLAAWETHGATVETWGPGGYYKMTRRESPAAVIADAEAARRVANDLLIRVTRPPVDPRFGPARGERRRKVPAQGRVI